MILSNFTYTVTCETSGFKNHYQSVFVLENMILHRLLHCQKKKNVRFIYTILRTTKCHWKLVNLVLFVTCEKMPLQPMSDSSTQ